MTSDQNVQTLALTGGIASGKSTFAGEFLRLAPETRFFDSDACVHQLLTNAGVSRMVTGLLGKELADSDGRLDKGLLRERVFQDQESRRTLEGILHPLVRDECQLARQLALAAPEIRFFLMDVPLLYESSFPVPRDVEIVVACGPATQRQRLSARSSLPPGLANRIISAQLPLPEKANRADVVIWNGGPLSALHRQTSLFLTWLKSKTIT